MCRVDHRELTSRMFARLVSEGGGVRTVECGECGERFVVSYGGPAGLFARVERLGGRQFDAERH